ncbi:C-C chemokine receptor type 2 [Nibea albiflora]|uniref:C-C chemokine receptor type 2 n=1 Tax=Nibea albiflora TaxID=240163 RepID=A0ACB7FB32_NIBAL|nr:C-C chemokine receptor type 2 [Nibea albiflora]
MLFPSYRSPAAQCSTFSFSGSSMEELNSTSNVSSPGRPHPPSWDFSELATAVVLSICFVLGVPGNIAVIIIRPNREHLSNLSQMLMLNLAMSDLLCLLTLPLWIYTFLYTWTLGLVACKLLTYLVYCSLYGSLLTVTALSVQRYVQVVYLQRCLYQTGKRRLLVLLWLVAMILSIPALVTRRVLKDQYWAHCQPHFSSPAQQIAVLLSESLQGFISFSVVAFAYIQLQRKVHQTAFFNNPRTTWLVTSIIAAFFVLWMPYLIINLLGVAAITVKNEGLLKFCVDSWNITGALTFVNSCLNPLLYAFASRSKCAPCQKKHVVNAEVRLS